MKEPAFCGVRAVSEQINWSQMSEQELAEFYWTEIAPDLRRQLEHDPDVVPTYQQLTELGYSGITYALREHHDRTLNEFCTEVLHLESDTDPTDTWGGAADATVDAAESYLQSLRTRGRMADSTVETRRHRLKKYVRVYQRLHGREDLLEAVAAPSERVAEIERALAVLDVFDADLGTDRSKLEYLRVAQDWYNFLMRRGRAQYNPLEGATEEFGWEREEPDNAALTAEQVHAIYQVADTAEERLITIALAGWGLRPSEVAELHTSQINLEANDPHLNFDDSRKNGPGTVALLVGVEALASRIDELTQREGWDGYLFPSNRSASGHIHVDTVRRRFKRLAADANVSVHGQLPKAKMGRRFWYASYQSAVSELLGQLEDIADEQGSASAAVVRENYLSESHRRQHRRQAMRESLASVFDVANGGLE